VVDRGLIVVDTCSLYNLQAGIRRDLYEDGDPVGKPVRRYLDLLPLLGERGFRVVVPEMVSVEMGGTLIGAPNINDLFSGSRRNQETTDGASAVKAFTERAKARKLPGVEIMPSDPATEHGQYLESLRQIAADPWMSRKRKCDLLAIAQKKDQRDFGERAALDAIGGLLEMPGGPVFFLSDDKGALGECESRFGDRVGRLNSKGFLGGVVRGGMAEHLHLKAEPEAMSHDLRNGTGSGVLIDNSRSRAEGNDGGFQRAVAALAAELSMESNGQETSGREPVAAEKVSRVEQFRQKWGWNGHRAAAALGVTEDAIPELIEVNGHQPHFINNHFEENKPMELAATASEQGDGAYEAYKQSFGHQVYSHRIERKMTPEILAVAVMQIARQEGRANEDTVMDWESGVAVPNRDQFKALVTILIEENRSIPLGKKAEEIEDFNKAYDRSRQIIEASTSPKNDLDVDKARRAFGRLLRKHSSDASMNLVEVAYKINKRMKISLLDTEEQRLGQEARDFIGAIQAGAVPVSKGLAVALVSALDAARELTEDEKRALYEAYEASAAKPQPSRVRPSKSANDNGEEPHKARKYASQSIPLSDEAGLIRLEIMDIFTMEGKTQPDVTAVGRFLHKKHSHGAVAPIYPLLNVDYIIKSEYSVKKALADKTRDMLSEYLAAHGKADMIPLFHEKFAELRKATHHRGRESLSELSV
jgi:hypothetical protein